MNRQWLLARHPDGAVSVDCFGYVESPRPPRPDAGMVLVRWELLLCAPTIRNWIRSSSKGFHPTVQVGTPVMAPAIGWVIESNNPEYPCGTRLFGTGSWQDEEWVDPVGGGYMRIADDVSSVDAMGVVGVNALTAYAGLIRIGQPQPGETLLVSGAAGSVGSIAAQVGRIRGCHVIGLCGGNAKRRWLEDKCGITDVIDYKSEDVPTRLDAVAPAGIDIYFDNIGGPLLRDVVERTKRFGRIVLCGQIATYDSGVDDKTPPLNMMRMIYGGIRMQGFIVPDHADLFGEAIANLSRWNREGLIAHREDVRDGFKKVPESFMALFTGTNDGTLLARIADSSQNPI